MSNDGNSTPTPMSGDSASNVARPLSDAEANRQVGDGKTPEAPRAGSGQAAQTDSNHGGGSGGEKNPKSQPLGVGGRQSGLSEPTSGDADGERTMYDRLAEKDVTPAEESGTR